MSEPDDSDAHHPDMTLMRLQGRRRWWHRVLRREPPVQYWLTVREDHGREGEQVE